MQLESALELQERLLQPTTARAWEPWAARRARDLPSAGPDVALGIAPAGPDDFRLAVRVQRRGGATGERVVSVVEAARGEADVRYVGRVEKRQGDAQQRHRPLVPGISVGHVDITAGTLGCFVEAGAGVAMLSNNHVLADENRAQPGDPILQPGAFDGGTAPADVVASLGEFVPIDPEGINLVDCAVATIADGIEVEAAELLGGGAIGSELVAPEAALGLAVLKAGRTTGRTRGEVTAFNVRNLVVAYDIGEAVRFDGQIEVQAPAGEDFSLGGDSGSLIVAEDGLRPVALLFAGSDQGGDGGASLTYANPIGAVLEALGATLYLGP